MDSSELLDAIVKIAPAAVEIITPLLASKKKATSTDMAVLLTATVIQQNSNIKEYMTKLYKEVCDTHEDLIKYRSK